MASLKEKRKTRRVQPYVAPCRIVLRTRRLAAYLADLSTHGARIVSDESLPAVGSRVVVEVRFGKSLAYSRLPGEVKWVKTRKRPRPSHLCGLTFRGITGEQQLALEFALYEFRRRAAQFAGG